MFKFCENNIIGVWDCLTVCVKNYIQKQHVFPPPRFEAQAQDFPRFKNIDFPWNRVCV